MLTAPSELRIGGADVSNRRDLIDRNGPQGVDTADIDLVEKYTQGARSRGSKKRLPQLEEFRAKLTHRLICVEHARLHDLGCEQHVSTRTGRSHEGRRCARNDSEAHYRNNEVLRHSAVLRRPMRTGAP